VHVNKWGVISRLAYADLLKEGGRPTLIIMDDALVHSDPHRLEQMQRVVFDASQRHQILVFTLPSCKLAERRCYPYQHICPTVMHSQALS
jgi:uncharacterized protein YhaN